jgi:UDP-glucose 4-epimerase
MSNILITGGVGFIGSYICKELLTTNNIENIVVLDHFGRYVDSLQKDFHDYRYIRFKDIKDKIIIERGEAKYHLLLTRIINKYRPDYIFHLASLPLAKIYNLNTEEALEGSVISTSNFIEILGNIKKLEDWKPKRFIYTSSSMVYGDWQSEKADENHPTNPKELYGTMKLAGEIITKGLSSFYDIDYTIIRPSAVYGPTDMNNRVTQLFINKALRGEVLKIHGKDEKLDFSYVKDVAKGFILAALSNNGKNETFNITGGCAHTLLEFALILKKYLKNLQYEIIERDQFRPKRGTLSIAKAKRLLGYQPKYTLENGIKEYVKFARRNL